MTIRFFIDDSGKDDPPVFVLGGIAIEGPRLESFESDWRAALATPPSIPFFKMKEANGRRGAFKGISSTERDSKVSQLGEVVRSHAVASLSVIVRHADYRRLFEHQMMRSMDRPYQIMFHMVIVAAFKLCRDLGIGGKADFIFDRQLEHEDELRASWPVLRQGVVPEISRFLGADPRHADDKDEVGLQAGDMVAWHVRRSWRDGTRGFVAASAAGSALAALPGRHDFLDEQSLQLISNIATSTVRGLDTVFPYEADRMSEAFDRAATVANLHLMMQARPGQEVELISFPATGIRRFELVSSCAQLGRPHLHRRSGNKCLGEASAV